MEKELKRTLADAARYINKTYDVEGLHSSFPERLEKLRKRRGDRLTEHWHDQWHVLNCRYQTKSTPQARELIIAVHRGL